MINYEKEYNRLCICYRKQQEIIKELLEASKESLVLVKALRTLENNKWLDEPTLIKLEQAIAKAKYGKCNMERNKRLYKKEN